MKAMGGQLKNHETDTRGSYHRPVGLHSKSMRYMVCEQDSLRADRARERPSYSSGPGRHYIWVWKKFFNLLYDGVAYI